MPDPAVAPPEAQDWRPVLDRELSRLSEKYRAAVVLCDLEGKTRREAARQLGLPEGTLSSRLTAARRLLARRLTRAGLTLSGGALAAALAAGAAAAVPAPWVGATAKAAALVAAGRAAAAAPATLLMNEVLRAMLLTKLKLWVAAALAVVVLGAGGVAYRAAGQAPGAGARPLTDLEVLRREVQILKLQVELLQEKVRGQEAALRALGRQARPGGGWAKKSDGSKNSEPGGGWARQPGADAKARPGGPPTSGPGPNPYQAPALGPNPYQAPAPGLTPHGPAPNPYKAPPAGLHAYGPAPAADNAPLSEARPATGRRPLLGPAPAADKAAPDPVRQAEEALRRLRAARDDAARRGAADALERALRRLRQRPQDAQPDYYEPRKSG
jgi:hypothetical protein